MAEERCLTLSYHVTESLILSGFLAADVLAHTAQNPHVSRSPVAIPVAIFTHGDDGAEMAAAERAFLG
jgi:hypothetical protein